ncbi:MAG: hypothetical protein H0V19_09620 [Euzebyales bacterium]|nr:hypothetical protein [Euzebyales bacterium]
MAVELDEGTALRIAELLDLFSELPSTPPVLTEEARLHAANLMEAIDDPRSHQVGRGHGGQSRH